MKHKLIVVAHGITPRCQRLKPSQLVVHQPIEQYIELEDGIIATPMKIGQFDAILLDDGTLVTSEYTLLAEIGLNTEIIVNVGVQVAYYENYDSEYWPQLQTPVVASTPVPVRFIPITNDLWTHEFVFHVNDTWVCSEPICIFNIGYPTQITMQVPYFGTVVVK